MPVFWSKVDNSRSVFKVQDREASSAEGMPQGQEFPRFVPVVWGEMQFSTELLPFIFGNFSKKDIQTKNREEKKTKERKEEIFLVFGLVSVVSAGTNNSK